MMNRKHIALTAAVLTPLALFAPMAMAAEHQDHERRQHGAHVHGEGELLIVLEDKTLEMSFRIPGMDLIGFEHIAKTKEQKESIQNAKAYLKKGDQVFELTGSHECELQRSSALFALTTHDHSHDEQEEGSHADEKEQQQDDEHSLHAEFHVKYKYECSQPEKLEGIVFNIFNRYEKIDKVKAVFILFSEQSAVTLTAENPEIRIKECSLNIGSKCLL